MAHLTENQVFNLVSGSAATGQSTYDMWKSIEGNEDKSVQDFLNYLKDDGESNVSEETLAQIEKNKNDISQLTEKINDYAIVTPQMYGAVGDGVTDDTQAFKNALAENDNVYVPKGNYLITDTLDISAKKSLYSDDGKRATIIYEGSNSIVNINRISIFRNINITIKNAFSGIVFNTDNRSNITNANACSSRVEHCNILFEVASPNATLIGITADSGTDPNNIPTKKGICFQTYRDIHLETSSKGYGYGIKMELIQGRPFTEENKEGFPWITHIAYDDIYLGQPHTAIKATATNTSGAELFNRVNMGHILFNNVYTQFRTGETEIFLDLDHFGGYFTKCIGWDYHSLTNIGQKVNIIGEGVTACFNNCSMNFGKEFLQTCDFTNETEYNVSENPEYFINKYFGGTVLSKGYDYIDAKIEAKLSSEYVANISEEKINEVLYSGYSNVMADPLTKIKMGVRFSNSSQAWETQIDMMAIIIPIVQGGNLIRWIPSDYALSRGYQSVFFFNDDELTNGVFIDAHVNLWDSNGSCLKIDNPSGYKYVSIPFDKYDDISSETMTMTINREINGDGGKSYTEYLKDSVIDPAIEEKVMDYAQPKGNYLTEHQDISGKVDNTETLIMVGVDKDGNEHTWTIYGKVVS